MTRDGADRRALLSRARLYLICDAQPGGAELDPFLHECLSGGVDVVQLRDKEADDDALVSAGAAMQNVCQQYGALFIVNDRPDLADLLDADGVHVGQDDVSVAAARNVVGRDRLVGLSTHSPNQVDAARGVDYIAVGPVFETPTKPESAAVGVELVQHAAAHASGPFFAVGGIEESTVGAVVEAGAHRVAAVRALTESSDPGATARALRQAVSEPGVQASVGPT